VLRELGSTEKAREVSPAKKAHEDVPLAQIGMSRSEKQRQGSGEEQQCVHSGRRLETRLYSTVGRTAGITCKAHIDEEGAVVEHLQLQRLDRFMPSFDCPRVSLP
jgi:hypothetical protein